MTNVIIGACTNSYNKIQEILVSYLNVLINTTWKVVLFDENTMA